MKVYKVKPKYNTTVSAVATICIAPWNFLHEVKKICLLSNYEFLLTWDGIYIYDINCSNKILRWVALTWTLCTFYTQHHALLEHPHFLWHSIVLATLVGFGIYGGILHKMKWNNLVAKAPAHLFKYELAS